MLHDTQHGNNHMVVGSHELDKICKTSGFLDRVVSGITSGFL